LSRRSGSALAFSLRCFPHSPRGPCPTPHPVLVTPEGRSGEEDDFEDGDEEDLSYSEDYSDEGDEGSPRDRLRIADGSYRRTERPPSDKPLPVDVWRARNVVTEELRTVCEGMGVGDGGGDARADVCVCGGGGASEPVFAAYDCLCCSVWCGRGVALQPTVLRGSEVKGLVDRLTDSSRQKELYLMQVQHRQLAAEVCARSPPPLTPRALFARLVAALCLARARELRSGGRSQRCGRVRARVCGCVWVCLCW
jgi:hypothetical protein